jgi:hypothetical protein
MTPDDAMYWISVVVLAVLLALAGLSAAAVYYLRGWKRALALLALLIGPTAVPYVWLAPATGGVSSLVCGVAYGGLLILVAIVSAAVLIGFAVGGILLYLDRHK